MSRFKTKKIEPIDHIESHRIESPRYSAGPQHPMLLVPRAPVQSDHLQHYVEVNPFEPAEDDAKWTSDQERATGHADALKTKTDDLVEQKKTNLEKANSRWQEYMKAADELADFEKKHESEINFKNTDVDQANVQYGQNPNFHKTIDKHQILVKAYNDASRKLHEATDKL